MAHTYEQIREIFLKLPEDLREAYFSENISDKIIGIGKKHRLNVDETGILGGETGLVLLGVEHPNKFIANLSAKLGVDKTVARDIAQDINEQVFRPVRDSLRKIHGITDDNGDVKHSVSNIPDRIEHREEILKEIEKDYSAENDSVPAIFKGVTNPFEAKLKQDVYHAPAEEKKIEEKKVEPAVESAAPPMPEKPKSKYAVDPYREPVE